MSDADVHAIFDDLVPRIADSLGKSKVRTTYELSVPNGSLYLSSMYFLVIKFHTDDDRDAEELKLVVKRPPVQEYIRQMLKFDCQFNNEIVFYKKFAGDSSDYPRCVYVIEKPPYDSIIALEDVGCRGYKLCATRTNMPLNYALAAMREIGRFHGRGYAMKRQNPDEFFASVKLLRECRYMKKPDNLQYSKMINIVTPRAVEYLKSQGHDAEFCDRMHKFFSSTYENIMLASVNPVEPLANLCHGDFTSNNVLFKQMSSDGLKQHAMLLDFALVAYSMPGIDTSTFLLLCCNNELLKDHFDEIFHCYHDGMINQLKELGVNQLTDYSYDSFLQDFKRSALFGYAITSFFLPVMLGYSTMPVEESITMDVEESAPIMKTYGGEEMSKYLADMLLQLKDFGCLDHIPQ